jgi:hypothetical protein
MLHGSFVRYRSSELPSSLESLYNSPRLQYLEFSKILLQLHSNSEVKKSRHSVQIKIFSSSQQLSVIATPESLIRLRHMGSHRKDEKVSRNVGMGGFQRWHLNWAHVADFSECSILSRTEFQQPTNFQKS